MPVIRPIDIISFSSEDPNNPASNLLSPDTFRKWKCKDPGEETAFVILKFEKAVNFLAINFGNEFSAFVEIFVARSGPPDPEYHSFVSQTALMSAKESRNGETGNRVKMLSVDKFNKKLASEKWDLVKIVCTQQFNTHIQFGLAYIEFVTPGDSNDKPKVGGFSMLSKALGSEDDDLSGSTSSGRLFAQRLQQKSGGSPNNNTSKTTNSPNSVSAAATIRQASTSLSNVAIASCEERVKELKKRKLVSKGTDEEEDDDDNKGKDKFSMQKSESESESESDSQSKKPINKTNGSSSTGLKPAKKYKRVYSKDDDENEEEEEDESTSSGRSRVKPGSSKVSKSSVSTKQTKKKQTKPFNKLFEDVIFVMSGYVNPKRANIRRKAEKMGAKCKHDWEADCTHLICTFFNTPKFREVRQSGYGNIVKEDWIEKSYDARIRFPWRRFCLDRNDKGDESEDEIYAEESEDEEEEEEDHRAGTSSSSRKQSQTTSRIDDEGTKRKGAEKNTSSTRESQDTKNEKNDNDDDVVLSPVKKKRKAIESDEEDEVGKSSNNLTEKETKSKSSKKDDDGGSDTPDDAYTADTDVENDANEEGTSDFFKEKVFYLQLDKQVPAAKKKLQKNHIEQIILRHKGKIATDMTEQVEYIVTDSNHWDEHFAEALLVNPNVNIVRLQWVIECERENEMTSTENFLILPESDDQTAVI